MGILGFVTIALIVFNLIIVDKKIDLLREEIKELKK